MDIKFEKREQPISLANDFMLSPIPHMHNELEIIYVKKGKSMVYADNSCHTVESGDIFIAFPNQVHYYETIEQGSYLIIIASAELIYGQKKLLFNNNPENNIIAAQEGTVKLLSDMEACYSENRITECVGYLNIIIGRAISKFKLLPSHLTGNSTLRSILTYCDENFSEEISLDIVAAQLHINKYYISHLLHNKLALGFSDYIKMLRVREARTMLSESNKKIADISEEVGFGTIRSFNRAFREVMNMTPMEYRDLQNAQRDLR